MSLVLEDTECGKLIATVGLNPESQEPKETAKAG